MSQHKYEVNTLVDAGETFITIGQEVTFGASHDPRKIRNQLPVNLNQETVDQFIQLIATTFTPEGLKWVCAVADIDEIVLVGGTPFDQARNLVEYAARHHNDLYELLHACESESCQTSWPRWREFYGRLN